MQGDRPTTASISAGLLQAVAGTPDRPLVIGDVAIPCYVLEDETRVLSQRGFLSAIGRSENRPTRPASDPEGRPDFLAPRNLEPFIGQELLAASSAIPFQPPGGGSIAFGYRATLLPDVCAVYLAARDAGALRPNQLHIAARADLLIRGLATVGIIALVDEATGYEHVREKRALATILERFIAKELRPWSRTFPYEFYEHIFRLKGWPLPPGDRRPQVIGHYTNDIVYQRLGPGVLDELRRKNPLVGCGWRKARHHQWFTSDYGHPKLKEHLAAVIALMASSPDWSTFMHRLDVAFPKQNATMAMPLDDDSQYTPPLVPLSPAATPIG